MGLAGDTPGGQRPWCERQAPTPEEATAEQHLVTARAYQPLDAYTRAWIGDRRLIMRSLDARDRDDPTSAAGPHS